ncbi:MAG: hypothetical protein WCQ16_06450, partial [Verrucomicrobiae bacterium]
LWLKDPRHASLHFKELGGRENKFSVKCGFDARLLSSLDSLNFFPVTGRMEDFPYFASHSFSVHPSRA